VNTQQTRPQSPFTEIPLRDFKRKFNNDRPRFAVNHDESIRNVIPLRSDNLEADGAAFSCALDWLMTCAGHDEAPRSFVRGVIGAIEHDDDGKGKRMPITDERLAELMNCSTKTIQRQRKSYLEQEQKSNFSIISVVEGEYDHKQGKHATTVYEVLIGKQIAQTVERARTSPMWKRDQFAAMREAAREVFNDIDEAPLASTKRKKKTLSPEKEARKIRNTIVSLAKRLGDQTRKIEDADVLKSLKLDELQSDIENALLSGDLRQAFVNKEVDPPTGHNVHQPPVPDAVHIQEERMWTPSTPPDEATDDAWASLENRLRREQPIDEPITDSSEDVDNFADNIIAFPDEPGELTYELDDDDLDDDDLAIIAAERAAIQDEANSLPLEPDEVLSLSANLRKGIKVTASTTQPTDTPPTTTATITSSPPLDDENAAYRYFEASIATRADELMRTQGMTARQADRAAWNEHGHFYAWLEKQRAAVAKLQHE
jgi:hypothetical protein